MGSADGRCPELLLGGEEAPGSALRVLRQQRVGCAVAAFAALLGLLTGWDVGYIGSVLVSRSFQEDVNDGRALSGLQAGLLVALQPAAAAIVALPCVGGALVEKRGRRGAMGACGALCAASAAVQATARDLGQMCFGRLLLGVPLGLSWVCPVYQGEVAPREARGALMGLFPLALTFGIFAASACSYATRDVPHGWTLSIWPMAAFGGALALGLPFCPESPRHLLHVGSQQRAWEALSRLRRGAPSAYVEREWRVMLQEVDEERQMGQATYRALFAGFSGRLLGVVVAGWVLFQLCGMPAFSYYGPKMFKMARVDAFAFQVLSTGLGFAMTIPALWIVDLCGRKPLLKWGAAGMGTSMLGLGLVGTSSIIVPVECPGSSDPTDCAHSPGEPLGEVSESVQAAIVISSLVFYASYSVSWGAVLNIFGNEVFPLKFRARAGAVGALASMLGNLSMGQFTPILMDQMHFGTFLVLAALDVACFAFACWIPETAGVQLEELIPVFERRLGARFAEGPPAGC